MKAFLTRLDLVQFAALWAGVFVFGPRNWIWVSGLSLSLLGAALCLLARHQLGASFAVRAEARRLVTTGLYRLISHPIYFFGNLSNLGLALAFQQWWILPLWLVPTVLVQRTRMKREDAVLEAEFGEEFRRARIGTIL